MYSVIGIKNKNNEIVFVTITSQPPIKRICDLKNSVKREEFGTSHTQIGQFLKNNPDAIFEVLKENLTKEQATDYKNKLFKKHKDTILNSAVTNVRAKLTNENESYVFGIYIGRILKFVCATSHEPAFTFAEMMSAAKNSPNQEILKALNEAIDKNKPVTFKILKKCPREMAFKIRRQIALEYQDTVLNSYF